MIVPMSAELTLAWHGVNDESFPGTSADYLAELRRRYEQQPLAPPGSRRAIAVFDLESEDATTPEVR